jgi:5-(carboxyamino)imidazole ribonucleotide synthase
LIIGIVGGGQLARMMALAGYPLGLQCVVLDPSPAACAGQVAELVPGDYDDRAKLLELARRAEVVTFDFENVPAESARFLSSHVPVFPSPLALEAAQDRLAEKRLFRALGIPTPPFATVESMEELRVGVARVGLPAVLKTRRFGYDGKGQRVLRSPDELETAWAALGGVPLLLEGFVAFEREVSVLAVRGRGGETAFYPLAENVHQDGILRFSRAPHSAPVLEREGMDYAVRLLDRLDYVGLLAIEFFVASGHLIINEIAPRVHNSGHWTIEGAEISQFENHLRAITGLPLGSTGAVEYSAMVNFIGSMPSRSRVLAIADAHLHDYGKVSRPGRKVGHVTLRSGQLTAVEAGLKALLALAHSPDR